MDFLLVFACCAAAVLFLLAVYSFTNDLSARQEAGGEASQLNRGAASAKLPTLGDIVSTAGVPRQLDPLTWREKCHLWIAQSGVDVSPLTLIGLACFAGLIPAGAVFFMTHTWALAALAYGLPALLPYAFVAIKRRRRCNRLREQLPDALDLMSRMLRAGQTITQSLRGVADEFEAPIADEFGYCYEQQNLGLSTDASMYEMARRTGVLELRILVVALTVHRRTGGNLSELLDNLAAVVRDRYRIYGQIRALTADGRMQAAILLALPPFLLAVLSVVNRDYIHILFQFPWLLLGMFAFELVGALWLRRIVSFDF